MLLITGYAESAILGNGTMEAGMQLLAKPFSLRDFEARVADILAGLPADAGA